MKFYINKQLLLLFGLGLYLFFLGNGSIFITDPVESNYALTASEMIRSGDYISPQIYGSYWYDKPIFFYWELAAAFKLFGLNEFAARFFPAVAGILGLWMTYAFAKKLYDARTGFFAALVLGTSFEYWLIAKTVITDMMLFVFFNAVLILFYLAYSSGKKHCYYGCYFFAGLAVLTKGPIGILLPGFIVTLFLLWRRSFSEIRHMKIIAGTGIFLLVGGSWYLIMYALHGMDFINTFLGVHNVLRATVSEHPRFDVWYYYMVIFLIGFFPWVFVVPAVGRKYWQAGKWPVVDETTGFLLIWAGAIAVFYQCMATKYPTYSFPYLLPLSVLAARFLVQHPLVVKRVVALNLMFYTVLTFFVAVPYGRDYSAKEAVTAIAAVQDSNEPIVSYGSYRTSAVFYSRELVYRLEKKENIDKLKPQAMNWNSKNVMPFVAEEELLRQKKALALADADSADQFQQEVSGQWKLIKKYKNVYVFEKEAATAAAN